MKNREIKNNILDLFYDLRHAFNEQDYSYYERNFHRYDAIEEFIKNNTYCIWCTLDDYLGV